MPSSRGVAGRFAEEQWPNYLHNVDKRADTHRNKLVEVRLADPAEPARAS